LSSVQSRKVRILVLEDKPRDAEAIKENLESYGWEVGCVSNASEFKEQVANSHFDVYVLDFDIPVDRGGKLLGGGEKALDILRDTIGLVPVIIYSGVLESELLDTEVIEKEVVEKGASYILRKGSKGSALAALIKRIINEKDEKIGLRLKSYFASRLGEQTFYMRLISERRLNIDGKPQISVTVEVQRLFDQNASVYEVLLDKDGQVIDARIQKT